MGILLAIGVMALVFGFLFIFALQSVSRLAAWSNQIITRTDDLISTKNKPVGATLMVAGLFMLWVFFTRR
jgi:hypothetical protein